MFELILIGIPLLLGVVQYIRILRRQVAGLEYENSALEREISITAEMEAANKLAEEREMFELEKVETDNWRNGI